MKKATLIAIVTLGLMIQNLPASVTFTGTALVSTSSSGNPLGLVNGQVGVWLNKDDSVTSWNSLLTNSAINLGQVLNTSATYNNDLFTVMGTTIVTGSSTYSLSGGIADLNQLDGISPGDEFAVMIFNTSTVSSGTLGGDAYKLWRATDWLIPSDGATISYSTTPEAGAKYQQLRTADYLIGSGSVAIPEPSSASLLALGVAGLVALRARRKS
jgi:hypothetical protein